MWTAASTRRIQFINSNQVDLCAQTSQSSVDILIQQIWRTNLAFATATQPFGRLQQVFPYLLRSFSVPPTVTRALKPSVAWSAVLAKTPPRYGHVSSSYYRGAFTLPM